MRDPLYALDFSQARFYRAIVVVEICYLKLKVRQTAGVALHPIDLWEKLKINFQKIKLKTHNVFILHKPNLQALIIKILFKTKLSTIVFEKEQVPSFLPYAVHVASACS